MKLISFHDKEKESREALQNFIRLSLLLDQGTEILRQIFRSRYRHMTQKEWRDECPKSGKMFVINFGKRLDKLNLCKLQRQMLERGQLDTWDLATLAALLEHVDDDTSAMKMENLSIRMLSRVANSCAHLSSTRVSDEKFGYLWNTAVTELVFLGGSSDIFDHILATPISTSCTKSFQCDDGDEDEDYNLVNLDQGSSSRKNSLIFLHPEVEESEQPEDETQHTSGDLKRVAPPIPEVHVIGPDELTQTPEAPPSPVTKKGDDNDPSSPSKVGQSKVAPRKTTKIQLTTIRVWEIGDGVVKALPIEKGGVSKWPKLVGEPNPNPRGETDTKSDDDRVALKNEANGADPEIQSNCHCQGSSVTKMDVGTLTDSNMAVFGDDHDSIMVPRSTSSCPATPISRRHGSFVCGSSEVKIVKKSPERKRRPILEANGYARDRPTSYALVGPTILSNSIILQQGTTAIVVPGDQNKQLRLKANHILPVEVVGES